MEDRYLFKGKRIDNEEWVQGNLITDDHDEKKCFIGYVFGTNDDGAPHDYDVVEVYQSTICQCTGLKDKNGKLIWENDIVGYYDKYVGKWFYGLVGYGEFNCSCCSGVYGWHFGDEDIREYKGYEVKGNKFDNPELLEV